MGCEGMSVVTHRTSKHHHVLEVGSDLVASPQIEEEGEGVDVGGPAQEHSQLEGEQVKERGLTEMGPKTTSCNLPYLILRLTF